MLVEKVGNARTQLHYRKRRVTPGGEDWALQTVREHRCRTEHDPVPNITHLARLYGTRVYVMFWRSVKDRPELRERHYRSAATLARKFSLPFAKKWR